MNTKSIKNPHTRTHLSHQSNFSLSKTVAEVSFSIKIYLIKMFDVRSRQYAQFRKWERKLNISSVMNIICNTIDRELENRREKTEKQFSLFERNKTQTPL